MIEKDDQEPITKGDLVLITYQLSELKAEVKKLTEKLEDNDDKYMKKSDFSVFFTEDYKPLKDNLGKINWLVISTVIIAVIGLVLTSIPKVIH